jgi:hypothetical protein
MATIPAQCLSPRTLVRTYNLMATALLALAGAGFGSVLLAEAGAAGKIDDGGLFAVAVAAVVWYLTGKNRFRLSATPLVLAGVAFLFQVAGLVIEASDSADRGDNIGGLIIYAPILIFLGYQYSKTRRLVTEPAEAVFPRG